MALMSGEILGRRSRSLTPSNATAAELHLPSLLRQHLSFPDNLQCSAKNSMFSIFLAISQLEQKHIFMSANT